MSVSLFPRPCGLRFQQVWSHFEDACPGLQLPSRCGAEEKRPKSTPFHVLRLSSLSSLSMGNRQERKRCCFFLTEIALAQLDRIKPLKQTVLKLAAVIGPVFTTQLLSHILPHGIRHEMNCLLDMLVSDNILKWLKTTEVPEDVRDPTKGPGSSRQAESGKW